MSAPWMPLYVADYLADTAHLCASEHGAYLLLIMHYWRAGKLPADERQLQRIARMTSREWANSRDTLAALFTDGWTHKRIENELAKSDLKSTARAESGSRGGKAKALKNNDAALANATVLPQQKDDFALASSSHSQPEKKEDPSSLRLDGGDAQPEVAEVDFRTDLFRRGLDEVVRATGVPAPKARALIGLWLKAASDEAVIVLTAIDAAVESRPADFVPWVRRAIENRMSNRPQQRAGPALHAPPRRGSAALFDALDRIYPNEPDSQTIPASPFLRLADSG